MTINVINSTIQSAIDTPQRFIVKTTTSRDGTTLGYRQIGHGPAVVLVHGSMSSGQNHTQLAEALANSFTVCLLDRRGRGLSGPYQEDHHIGNDVEDLEAILTETGAQCVFGVSFGAIVGLQAALTLSSIPKLAIYEPPLFLSKTIPTAFVRRFDQEMAQGKVAAALTTAMLGAQLGPKVLSLMPRLLAERLTTMMMAGEDKQAKEGDVTFRTMAPSLHYEGQIIAEKSGALDSFAPIGTDVLLLGGSQSPSYMKLALNALADILPQAKRITFSGLGHSATWNTNRGGKPGPVAQALHAFFS